MKWHTLFVENEGKSWDFETYVRSVIAQDIKRKRNDMNNIQFVTIAQNLEAKRQNFSKVLGTSNGIIYDQAPGDQVSQSIYLTSAAWAFQNR